jgi:hypothetical protein
MKQDIAEYFFKSYFHQDWHCDYKKSLDAVVDFIENETELSRRELLFKFKDMIKSEELSENTIYLYGGNFNPEVEGRTIQAWIECAINLLQK